MRKIKIVAKGFEGFNGHFGQVKFKDGVSVDPLPDFIADRVSASVACKTVDEDGEEIGHANPAARLVGGATIPAQVGKDLDRATEAELRNERRQMAESKNRPPVEKLYSLEELEEVASNKGIKGLRVVGDPWGVRGRSIPDLISEIMRAQGEHRRKHETALAAVQAEREKARQTAIDAAAAREKEVSENGRNLVDEAREKDDKAKERDAMARMHKEMVEDNAAKILAALKAKAAEGPADQEVQNKVAELKDGQDALDQDEAAKESQTHGERLEADDVESPPAPEDASAPSNEPPQEV